MGTAYDSRILAEIDYGNYSYVKDITGMILKKEPDNLEMEAIRSYIEYHKKSNGRYEKLSIREYVSFISRSKSYFSKDYNLDLFISVVFEDYFNVDKEHISYLSENDIKSAISNLVALDNERLQGILHNLYAIQKQLQSIKETERKNRLMEIQIQQEEEEKQRKKRIIGRTIFIIVAIIIMIIIFLTRK